MSPLRQGVVWPSPVAGYTGDCEAERLGLITKTNITTQNGAFEILNYPTAGLVNTALELTGWAGSLTFICRGYIGDASDGERRCLFHCGYPLDYVHNGIALIYDANGISFRLSSQNIILSFPLMPLPVAGWHTCGINWNPSGTNRTYIDGELVAEQANPATALENAAGYESFGMRVALGHSRLTDGGLGLLSPVRFLSVFNRELSESNIATFN